MPDIQPVIAENEDLIRARAHQFWEDEGRPDGRHLIHWQRAVDTLTVPPTSLTAHAKAVAPVSDITLIDGIGPKIAQLLAAEGVETLSQLAAMPADALEALDSMLGLKGRSQRDGWIAQARELLAGAAPRAKVDRRRAAIS